LKLIGGPKLLGKIEVIDPSKFPPSEDLEKIYLTIAESPEGTVIGDRNGIVRDAINVIERDFQAKANIIDSFVSIRLHTGFFVQKLNKNEELELDEENIHLAFHNKKPTIDGFYIDPGEFLLCESLEKVWLPKNVIAFLQSRTSIARFGLDVTPTNMVIPGFNQNPLTFHLCNHSNKKYHIPRYFPLAEVFFAYVPGDYGGEAEVDAFTRRKLAEEPPESGASRLNIITSLGVLVLLFIVAILIRVFVTDDVWTIVLPTLVLYLAWESILMIYRDKLPAESLIKIIVELFKKIR
jgi:deoxycytidine triphosphate deaminase